MNDDALDSPYTSAFYGTDVFHYAHVIEAMKGVADNVDMMGRFELTPDALNRVNSVPLPSPVKHLLARRVATVPIDIRSHSSLGNRQFVFPGLGQLGLRASRATHRRVIDSYAKRAERYSRESELFHFVEGLGHVALAGRTYKTSICERRHLHHNVLESDPGIAGDFPYSPRADPIGDFLDFEYEQCDFIFVYSEIARSSFLARGFSPSKVKVAPLGIPAPLALTPRIRDPYLLAFVGRADAHKGIDVAVAAVEALGHPYRLQVAGPTTPSIRRWLATKTQVTVRGILSRNELRDVYSTSAAVVAPSIESFGYAPVEATSHGALLFCSEQTGALEYLPEPTRVVITGRNPLAWAQGIEGILRDIPTPELERATASREAIRSMSWAGASQRLLSTYRDIAPSGGR